MRNGCDRAIRGNQGPCPDMHASCAKDMREGVNSNIVFQGHSVRSPDSCLVAKPYPRSAEMKLLHELFGPIILMPPDELIDHPECKLLHHRISLSVGAELL